MKKQTPERLEEIVLSDEDQPQVQLTKVKSVDKEGGDTSAGLPYKRKVVEKKRSSQDIGGEGWSKSRRGQQKSEAKEIHEYFVDDQGHKWIKPMKPQYYGKVGESMFLLIQVICIICYGCFTKYGEGMSPDTLQEPAESGYDAHRDVVQNLYPFFQDVHVMIFIGFGFLMSFIKTLSWTTLAFNWIVSIWALQWAILFIGFFHQAFSGKAFHKIEISLESLIMGDFGAGAAMITFGVILGKCSLQQLLCLVWLEMIFYGLNEAICVQVFKVTDAGGSILVHTFGAYFGIGASFFFQPGRAMHSKNLVSSYQSEMIAVIGSIFLWMYWPSFNGALASGVQQQRIIVNTVLAIGSSCFGGAITARFLFGKLEMEILLNASLAGGVAIGSTCDLITEPWAALTIGLAGGILSSVGFQKIGPYLADKFGLQDTCGVNSLHGMPGIFAALTSAIYIPTMGRHNFPSDYFAITAEGGSYGKQAGAQIISLLVTLVISLASGALSGYIASREIFNPVYALFRDDDHFYDMIHKYPKSYLEGTDEHYHEIKSSLTQIKTFFKQQMAAHKGDVAFSFKAIAEKVWSDHNTSHDLHLHKGKTKVYLTEMCQKIDKDFEMTEEAFEQIFKMIDVSGDHTVSMDEMIAFLENFISGDEKQVVADA